MALKATVFKIQAELADMDRQIYASYNLTVAAHPSETEERMMVRFLAFVFCVPESEDAGKLEFANDICDTDGPSLWQRDLTGQIEHWIELGQPDERRILRACGRSRKVSVFSYGTTTDIWWNEISDKMKRARNVQVWQIPASQSRELTKLVGRTMKLNVTIQDGTVWVGGGYHSVEIVPLRLRSSGD